MAEVEGIASRAQPATDDAATKEGKTRRRQRNRGGKAGKKEGELKGAGNEVPREVEGKFSKPIAGKGKGAKRKKSKGKKGTKEKSAGEEGGEGGNRTKLKVIVRRLPPNLPEEVFWKAIVPWTQNSTALRPYEAAPSLLHGLDSDSVLGRLPADTTVAQGYYVPGKLKDDTRRPGGRGDADVRPHTFSRAYLRFKTVEALVHFHQHFDGHLFRDGKGNEYVAVVEFASFQKMPSDVGKRKRVDAMEGTIEADGEYAAFVESLTKETGTGEQMSAEKTDAQLMAHLTSLNEASQLNRAAKSTPLLDHLRRQRTVKAEAAALKQARKYLNKSHNAYAATASASTTSASGGKGRSKGKEKQSTADAVIPTGPKAMRKGKADANPSKASETKDGGEKKKGPEKTPVKKEGVGKPGKAGAPNPAGKVAGKAAVKKAERPVPAAADGETPKGPRNPRRQRDTKANQNAGEKKAAPPA